MSDIVKMMNWMRTRQGKVSYSMQQRLGPNSYDCSSAVFNALIAGGFLKQNSFIGNTETLYNMENKLLMPISRSQAAYGDLFVSGVKGGSLGSGGHTGLFLSNSQIIHCTYSYGKNNMAVTQAKGWMGDYSGLPVHCYRLKGENIYLPGANNKPQMNQLVADGSFGPVTAKRLQEYLGCATRDGIISHQYKSVHNQYIYAAQFDNTLIGSDVVAKLQALLGINQDRLFGPATVKALQKQMGTVQDGIISPQSDCVREMQKRLNQNKL